MDKCRVVAINNLISYISPTENPLSANVVMIQGKDALWLYDVGNHPDIPAIIDTYSNGKKLMLSCHIFTRIISVIFRVWALMRCIRESIPIGTLTWEQS